MDERRVVLKLRGKPSWVFWLLDRLRYSGLTVAELQKEQETAAESQR